MNSLSLRSSNSSSSAPRVGVRKAETRSAVRKLSSLLLSLVRKGLKEEVWKRGEGKEGNRGKITLSSSDWSLVVPLVQTKSFKSNSRPRNRLHKKRTGLSQFSCSTYIDITYFKLLRNRVRTSLSSLHLHVFSSLSLLGFSRLARSFSIKSIASSAFSICSRVSFTTSS